VTQSKLGAGVAGNGPAFSAYLTANALQTNGVATKVVFDAESWDVGSCYNTTTGRFTPNVAGYYQLNCSIDAIDASSGPMTLGRVEIYKNGSSYRVGTIINGSASNVQGCAIVYANGTTDYFEIYYTETGGVGAYGDSSGIYTWFDGALVRAA
jgi:hypothetical protein